MKEFKYVITDPEGIHARPAGMLVREAKKYQRKVTITKDGKTAEASKLMAVMSSGVKCGQTVQIAVDGPDEEAAAAGIQAFFEGNL